MEAFGGGEVKLHARQVELYRFGSNFLVTQAGSASTAPPETQPIIQSQTILMRMRVQGLQSCLFLRLSFQSVG